MARQSQRLLAAMSSVFAVFLLVGISLQSPVTAATFFDPFELFCDTPECTATTFIPKPPIGICPNGTAPVVTLCAGDGDVNGDDGHLQLKIEDHVVSSCSFGLMCFEPMSRVPQPRNCGEYLDEPFIAPVNQTLLNGLAHASPSLVKITVDNHNSGAGGGCPYEGHYVYASARFSCHSPGQPVVGSPLCPPLSVSTTSPPAPNGTAPAATTSTTTPPANVSNILDEIPLRCKGSECVASAVVAKPSGGFCKNGRLALTVCAGDGDVNGDDGHLLLKLNGVQVAACSFGSAGVCHSSKTPQLRNCGHEPTGNQFVFFVNRTLVTSAPGQFLSLTLDNNDSGAGFGCPFFNYHLFAYARFSCLPFGSDAPLASPSCPPLSGQTFPTTSSAPTPPPAANGTAPATTTSPTTPPANVSNIFDEIPLRCKGSECVASAVVAKPSGSFCKNGNLVLTVCAGDGDVNGDDGHLLLKLNGVQVAACSFGSAGVCHSSKTPQLRNCGYEPTGNQFVFMVNRTLVTSAPGQFLSLTLDNNDSGAGFGCPFFDYHLFAYARFSCLPFGTDEPPASPSCPPLTGQAFPTTTSDPTPILDSTSTMATSASPAPIHSFFGAIPLFCTGVGCQARELVLQPEDAVCANDRELRLTLCAADGDINGDDGHLQLKLDGSPIGSCSFGSDGVCTPGKDPQLRNCGHSEPGHPNVFVLNKTMVTHPPSRHMVLTLDANGSGAGSGCPFQGYNIYAIARFACVPPGSAPEQWLPNSQCPPLSQQPPMPNSTSPSTTPHPAASGGLLLREGGASVSFGDDGQVRLSRTGNMLDVSSEVRVGGMKVQETMQLLLAEVASLRQALNMSMLA